MSESPQAHSPGNSNNAEWCQVRSFLGTTTNRTNMDSIYHNRQYSRVNWHNYDVGMFFVTFNTLNKVHYFGHVENGRMQYTEVGEKMASDILDIQSRYSDIIIDEWVVMPNHVHLIIKIGNGDPSEGTIKPSNRQPLVKGSKRSRLSSTIGNLKSGVKRYANQNQIQFNWNPRFYEHIIMTEDSYQNIKEYIQNNIKKWDDRKS